MTKILVPIDHTDSSMRALIMAINRCNKDSSKDEIHLVHFFSFFDYLNDEKNNGKLYLEQARNLCELSKVSSSKNILVYLKLNNNLKIKNVITCQGESISPQREFVEYIEDNEIDVVFVGEDSFVEVSNPDNIIYRFFSAVKRLFVGSLAQYLKRECKCEVVIAPAVVEQVREVELIQIPHHPPIISEPSDNQEKL